jgi:PAS domain S-box-containing protein
VRNGLVRAAKTAASFVDGDLHGTFTDPSQEVTPAYERAVDPLRRVLRARPDIRFLYTMVLRDGAVHIVLDATARGDADGDGVEDHSPIMQLYEDPAPALLEALMTGRAGADSEPVVDRWGAYLSGYAPFFDSAGNQAGIVGVDLRADAHMVRLNTMRRSLRAGGGLALCACTGLGCAVWLSRRRIRRVEHLRRRTNLALRRSEESHRALVENTPDLIFRLDAENRFTYVSPAIGMLDRGDRAEALLGCTFDEVFGKDESGMPWGELLQAVWNSGRSAEGEIQRVARGGLQVLNVRLFAEHGPGAGVTSVMGMVRDITAHRQAERDYRQLFVSMVEGFALHEIECDADGKPVDYRFLGVNPAFERLTGLRAADLLGRRVLEVMPGTEPSWIAIYGEVALGGRAVTFEQHSVELQRYYEVSAYSPVRGQFACMFSDITQRRRAEEALREREERYRSLVDALGDALFVYGISPEGSLGAFLEVNEEAVRRLGYTRDELLRMTPLDLGAPESAAAVRAVSARLLAGERVVLEGVHVAKGGRRIPVEMRLRAFPLAGQTACIALVHDITERRRLEEESRKVQAQIQHVQKLEGLGLLAGGIAHDFNNLLMAVLGNADLALEDLPAGSPGRSNVQEVKVIAVRAAELCRQMLAYSGKGKFVVEPLDLSELVEDMAHLLTVSISKRAMLKVDYVRNLPSILADASQMRQVVMNLVINASEAVAERSGVISISTGLTECDAAFLRTTYLCDAAPGLFVTLEVSDTGCGMDAATLARIFDPFFTTKFTGRGLGLAAVLGIVRGHKGAIKVSSEPGRGTTFKVLFPASMEPALARVPDGDMDGWSGSGTILLVDDEEPVKVIARRMLERSGFQVITASDGREGVERFRECADRIVAVIMDLTMPHMDGDAAFGEMHRLRSDVPVILSSGYTEQDVEQRVLGRGVAGYIQKPYTRHELLRVLRRVLDGGMVPRPPLA